jgi:hypothetical protein
VQGFQLRFMVFARLCKAAAPGTPLAVWNHIIDRFSIMLQLLHVCWLFPTGSVPVLTV